MPTKRPVTTIVFDDDIFDRIEDFDRIAVPHKHLSALNDDSAFGISNNVGCLIG